MNPQQLLLPGSTQLCISPVKIHDGRVLRIWNDNGHNHSFQMNVCHSSLKHTES